MKTDLVTMSANELERLSLMRRIAERRTTQREVAEQLGLSVRQVERLYAGFKARGAEGLVSRKRGTPSNRRLPAELRTATLGLMRAHYADFGPTFAHEKLVEKHGVEVSVETLRKWMQEDGLWKTRRERRKRVQQPRRRRACVGELVQIDGSDHEWFEDRGPRCTLLVFVDDATGRLQELRFAPESTFDYFESTRRYLERYGKPVAFYSDKLSVFRVNAKDPQAGDGYTQFGRALSELNIDIICANSAAAKGRVERANLTLQDRLVKELRLRGISTVEAGNAFLPEFREDFNRRFAREPQSAHDAHRPLLAHESLDQTFTLQEQRKVSSNLTLHYNRVMYLLEPSELSEAARGRHVQVREYPNGEVRIFLDKLELPARPFPKDNRVRQGAIVSNKLLAGALTVIQGQQQERDRKTLEEHRLTRRQRTHLEEAMATAWPEVGDPAAEGPQSVVDSLVADALRALATRTA
jgi:Helix-turn-helix domain